MHRVFHRPDKSEHRVGGDQARENGGPIGRANGIGAIGICKPHTMLSHVIEVRGWNVRVAITAQCPGTLVICHDQDEVGHVLIPFEK